MTATSTESDGDSTNTVDTIDVTLTGVAEPENLTVSDVVVNEDSAILKEGLKAALHCLIPIEGQRFYSKNTDLPKIISIPGITAYQLIVGYGLTELPKLYQATNNFYEALSNL